MPSTNLKTGLILALAVLCTGTAICVVLVVVLARGSGSDTSPADTHAGLDAGWPDDPFGDTFRPEAAGGAVGVEERQEALALIIRARVETTPQAIDTVWLRAVCEHIRDVHDMEAYYGELMVTGAQKHAVYVERERQARKTVTRDPRFFITLARTDLYSAPRSARRIDRNCRDNLAIGLYMEAARGDTLKKVDESFMSPFLRELVALYTIRRDLAARDGDDRAPWVLERQRALEVAVTDRHLRLERERRREPVFEEENPGPHELWAKQIGALERSLYDNLLQLGQHYLEVAGASSHDRAHVRANAERAYAALAMVYGATESPRALAGLMRVNEIQRRDLHFLGRARWKRAQLDRAAGDPEAASGQFYHATRFYNDALARSVGEDRAVIGAEFVRLKLEIAEWHATRRGDSTAAASSRGP